MIKKRDRKSSRELRQELKKKKHVEVELMSLTNSNIVYECPKTNYSFTLSELGQKEVLELDLLSVMANKYKGFFSKHLITITDFDDDEYTVEDLLDYLGLTDIYDGIDNPDGDYIKDLLELDSDDFEKFIKTKGTPELIASLAERMIYLFYKGKFDSYTKSKLIGDLLGGDFLEMDTLFDVSEEDIKARNKKTQDTE